MPINLKHFYELMEADYQRMMQIVGAGPYAAHPDVLKIKALNPSVLFEKGQNLESIASEVRLTNPRALIRLKQVGEEVDRLTKLIEKTVTTEITHPVLQKAMLRFLIKYVRHVNEEWVVPESEMIRLRFAAKKKEIAQKFIHMSEMLSKVREVDEIPGIIEALGEDQQEAARQAAQESEIKMHAGSLEPEQALEEEAFEVVTPLKFKKCVDVFKGIEGQIDYFLYQFFVNEVSGIWENEHSEIFDSPAANKIPNPVKKVNNETLRNSLQLFVTTLMDADPTLKKVWEGEKISIFQQLWSVTENQKKCQKMAIALYFKSVYSILGDYDGEVKRIYQVYQKHHSARTNQINDTITITDIKSLLSVFSRFFISGASSQSADLEKAWAVHVESCEALFSHTNQQLMLANAAILEKLEAYGFDRTKPNTQIGQMFMELNQTIEEALNPTFEDQPQWGKYHPLYADNQEAVKMVMPPHEEKKETRKVSPF